MKEKMNENNVLNTLRQLEENDAKDVDLRRENANVDGDTAMGKMLQFGSNISKEYTHTYLLDSKISMAHKSGDIHIHDLDFYPMGTTTCLQIPLDKLFKDGFNTGHGHLRKPNSIASYAALAAIAIQSNQNDQHGGQAIPMFDYYLAPGVLISYKKLLNKLLDIKYPAMPEKYREEARERIDALESIEEKLEPNFKGANFEFTEIEDIALKEVEKETYQAMEGFIHNLNTMHSRAGAQVPFSSINFGTDISPEGRMVTRNYLLALEAGLGNGETPIFPIAIFKVKEGVNYFEEDINYDLFELSARVSAKRMFPNYSFLDSDFNKQFYKEGKPETEATYMGCRTRVIADVTDPEDQQVVGRGNLSFTTVNLPRLGLKHGVALNGHFDKEGFFNELEEKMELVKDQLLDRFDYQTNKRKYNFPFLLEEGNWKNSDKLSETDNLREALKHGTLTVGFIGLAETLVALTGKHHGESEEARELGYEIIKFMKDTVDEYAKQYTLNFSLIATPAEGLSGRFVKIDRDVYGEIKGITDRDYYTNSFHVPVYYDITAKEKIEIEAPYHALTNAGHISYIELDGDVVQNNKAFVSVVKMMKEAGMGYGAINHPLDRDPVCGFSGIIKDQCPGCGRYELDVPFERIRRITGYLVGTTERFNNAKKAEEQDRVKHGR